jgi:hypothetical protein
MHQFDQDFQNNKRLFLDEIRRMVREEVTSLPVVSDELRQQRTMALWAGLRRVYFAEPDQDDLLSEDPPAPRTSRLRRLQPRVPDDLHVPDPRHEPTDDSDDAPSGPTVLVDTLSSEIEETFDDTIHRESSNGEDDEKGVNNKESENGEHSRKSGEHSRKIGERIEFLLNQRRFDVANGFMNGFMNSRGKVEPMKCGRVVGRIKKQPEGSTGERSTKSGFLFIMLQSPCREILFLMIMHQSSCREMLSLTL